MDQTTKQRLVALVDQLIAEGDAVLASRSELPVPNGVTRLRPVYRVNHRKLHKWYASCQGLMGILGQAGHSWSNSFANVTNEPAYVERILGTLEGIRQAIDQDLLITVERLVLAETFDNLLEQADYLLSAGYFVAAGVLGRAVLEERLRKRCADIGCAPQKDRPTLNDYKAALYNTKALDKLQLKAIEHMAGIGNDAAHNLDTLRCEDVEHLLRDIRDFLTRDPLS